MLKSFLPERCLLKCFPSLIVINVFQVMVTNVTSLLKTVKAVEDEHTRGTRALESTIEAISQEIEVSTVLYRISTERAT